MILALVGIFSFFAGYFTWFLTRTLRDQHNSVVQMELDHANLMAD